MQWFSFDLSSQKKDTLSFRVLGRTLMHEINDSGHSPLHDEAHPSKVNQGRRKVGLLPLKPPETSSGTRCTLSQQLMPLPAPIDN